MKRIACKPSLYKKASVISSHRQTHLSLDSNNFYQEISKRGGDAKVCVIRSLGGIGDVLMITPTLRELKRRFPKLHLTFAIDRHSTNGDVYFKLVQNAPFLDDIIDARYVNRSLYNAIIDISAVCIKYEKKGFPNINRIDLFAKHVGLNHLTNYLPYYKTVESEKVAAKKLINKNKKEYIVALHTASFAEKRTWPSEKYKWLIRAAAEDNLDIKFLVFDFNHKLKNWNLFENAIDCSNTSLREMAALIEQADLFIGPDSGPMHLAGALGTRSIVLFGSVPPQARINHYPSHESIVNDKLSCLGCWYAHCNINYKCMKDLDAQIVYKRMNEILGSY